MNADTERGTPERHAEQNRLETRIGRQVERMKLAQRDRPTVLGQSVYLGTLGLLFVLPVIGGAYLGSWLDGRLPQFAVHWTVGLILLGVVVGAVNVYLFTRE